MITFFASPRPFAGEFREIQRTAIASWLSAAPGAQAILIGEAEGAHEMAESFGIEHYGDVATNEWGTELAPDVFRIGIEHARHDWICALNADNVVSADIVTAIEALSDVEKPFVIGQRTDVDPSGKEEPQLHQVNGVDWFLFRKGTVPADDIPPFAVGRTCHDNWLVWAAVERWGLTVIDATHDVLVIHLNHGYPEYGSKELMLQSAEKKQNARILWDNAPRPYRIDDAPWSLVNGEMKPRV